MKPDSTTPDVNARDDNFRTVEDDLDDLKKDFLVFAMNGTGKLIGYLDIELGIRRASLVIGATLFYSRDYEAYHEFDDATYDAREEGVITANERRTVMDADAIVRAVCRETGRRVYVAVEASNVIDGGDVERARRMAEILDRVFPKDETASAVYGRSITDSARESAVSLGVVICGVA